MNYPIGIQTFEVIRKHCFAYVNKTGLLYDLVGKKGYYFRLSRRTVSIGRQPGWNGVMNISGTPQVAATANRRCGIS